MSQKMPVLSQKMVNHSNNVPSNFDDYCFVFMYPF